MRQWASRTPWLNVLVLFAILAGVSVGVWMTSTQLLAGALIANEREQLARVADAQVVSLETQPEGEAARPTPGAGKQVGETGEVVVARLDGDVIEFRTDADPGAAAALPLDSDLAEPMRRAVLGETGTMVGIDHRGERVVAAYRPATGRSIGVVVKIDLAEVREPVREANATGIPVSIAIIAVGTVAFALAGQPLQRRALGTERRFSRLVETMGEGVAIVDADGNVSYANRRYSEILGRPRDELVGRPLRAHLDLPETGATSGGTSAFGPFELSIITGNGDEAAVLATLRPIDDRQASGGGAVVVLTDITERQRAEKLLRASEDRYRSLFENAALGMYRTTPDGRILATNQTALRMLGFASFQELADRNLEAEGYEPTYPRAQYKERMERDGELSGFESAWIRKDGSTLYVRENARAVRNQKGDILFYEGTIEDISAEKEAEDAKKALEARLIQTQKLESVGTLAGGVAHEINNPLTGVINYAQLIHDRADSSELRSFAQEIIDEGTRVASIVRSLLSFSRQDKKQHSPANMADIVASTLSLIGAVLRKDQIQLTVDVAPELPMIRCRSQQIQQVLVNLLTNARDALNRRYPEFDEDKTVRLTVRAVELEGTPWVRTVVEDHGGGIPAEIIERIFDPFFSTKPRYESAGLGLSISYGMVREHRGRLSVESEPDRFTRFIMDLPIGPDQPLIA